MEDGRQTDLPKVAIQHGAADGDTHAGIFNASRFTYDPVTKATNEEV
jgi:hypothetical protein